MSRITATYAFDGTGYIEGCHVRVEEQVNVHGERSEHVVLETIQLTPIPEPEVCPDCALRNGHMGPHMTVVEAMEKLLRERRAVPIGREREEG